LKQKSANRIKNEEKVFLNIGRLTFLFRVLGVKVTPQVTVVPDTTLAFYSESDSNLKV
jgi:hypothetical protein